MKRFKRNPSCIKCGHVEHSVEFLLEGAEDRPYKGKDCIKRVCGLCGYTWYELPLDTEQRCFVGFIIEGESEVTFYDNRSVFDTTELAEKSLRDYLVSNKLEGSAEIIFYDIDTGEEIDV